MKRSQLGWIGFALIGCLTFMTIGHLPEQPIGLGALIAQAQSPKPSVPNLPTATPVTPAPPTAPSPADPVPPAPLGQPVPPLPVSPLPPVPPSVLPAAPPLTAPPLPISGEYQDAEGRFKIGVLKGYTVSPLAGSVLMEAPDGNLAYTVVAQSQQQLGLTGSFVTSDVLADLAKRTFQQGEGFQPRDPMALGEGIYLEWVGNLTIAGKTQPIGGVIITRQSQSQVLLLLLAATQAGAGDVPGALRALVESLQPLG